MHICFICNEYPPGRHGGVGSFTQTLGRALARNGCRVTVAGVYPIEKTIREDDEGVAVIRLPHAGVRGAGFIVNGRRLASELEAINRQHKIDVIDGPELSFANIRLHAAATKVIRMNGGHHFFTTTLGQRPAVWRGWQERRSFARADELCAVSEFIAETTRGLLKLGNRPIEILPNPVDTERFKPRPDVHEEDGLIVFTGTLCEKKGVRQLVQAMPRIVAEVPQARLLLIGRDSIDPLTGASFKSQMEKLIEPRLQPHVKFADFIDNSRLPETLASASVCVYPSHMEAQGIVIIEGMAMSKAVVTGKTGPGPELVEEEVSGMLCDPYDPASIAAKVVGLLKDPSLRRQIGARARLRAVNKFSVETLVRLNTDFYHRCVENHRNA
ncbi:MAG: D-inositol-3-phosphate glycosyltransferase [Acidobacteria bacterium]|nr:D-inositol-3-phosphate glycosyltransferase [Acidobacteriota bacterium]